MPVLELELRRAPFAPSTWNAETRTVEAIISTGADVLRKDSRGIFSERLDLMGVDLAALIGLPVLADHEQSTTKTVGVIADARREGGNLVALIRFSAADDVRDVVTKVSESVLRGISVGYSSTNIRETTEAGRRIQTATPVIREITVTPIGADRGATIRSATLTTTLETTAADPAVQSPPRAATIRSIAETAGLDNSWADAQIDGDGDLHAVRAAAFAVMQTRTPPPITGHVRTSGEDPAVLHERRAEALACQMSGGTPSDAARPFMAMSLVDFARDALTRSGASVAGLGREEILTRSLAMHTTSDFAGLLTDAGQRVLLPAYQKAASPTKTIARQRTNPDFRPISLIRIGEFTPLKPVTESGEIRSLTTGETATGYALETLAGMFSLSRKALINDDLNAFARWGEMMGQAAAAAETDAILALLLESNRTGPVMVDGKRLFHADHGNIAAPAAVLSVESLSAGRLAMRKQTGLDGKTLIAVAPKYLLVAPDLETEAEKILATLSATTVADQNPFSGSLTLLVEPRLPAGAWMVFADPSSNTVLEYAYLSSAQGPQLSSRDGWSTLSREFRVVLDFGAGAVDWRGAYKGG